MARKKIMCDSRLFDIDLEEAEKLLRVFNPQDKLAMITLLSEHNKKVDALIKILLGQMKEIMNADTK